MMYLYLFYYLNKIILLFNNFSYRFMNYIIFFEIMVVKLKFDLVRKFIILIFLYCYQFISIKFVLELENYYGKFNIFQKIFIV